MVTGKDDGLEDDRDAEKKRQITVFTFYRVNKDKVMQILKE